MDVSKHPMMQMVGFGSKNVLVCKSKITMSYDFYFFYATTFELSGNVRQLVGKLQTTSLLLAPLLHKLQVVCCIREAALHRQVAGHLHQFLWVGPCPLGNLLENAPKPNWPSVQAIFGAQPSHVWQMNGLFCGMPQRIHEVNYAQCSFHQIWDRIHGHRDSRGVIPSHHRIKRLWRNANPLPLVRVKWQVLCCHSQNTSVLCRLRMWQYMNECFCLEVWRSNMTIIA